MLERCENENGLVYYASPKLRALGVRHAFSTRLGGISKPPFDSLNMGNPNGAEIQDDYANIWQNYRLLLTEIDCPADPPLRVHQVHGGDVTEVRKGNVFDTSCKADGIVSEDADRPISVRVADCLPVLISSRDGKTVAAVHAGWRGLVAMVIPRAISALRVLRPGLKADELVAAMGPCIGVKSFEVGPEVIAQFHWMPNPPMADKSGKGHIDLREAAKFQLLKMGLNVDAIDSTDLCTFANREEFFSHRRDNGITGRMTAIIAPNRS